MNQQTKHTPGPWHVGMKPGPIVYGPIGEQVADLTADLIPKDERLANLRLIAAAPELLEALEAIYAVLNQPVQFTWLRTPASTDILRGDATLARKIARSAISKATSR